ncbi:MAG: DUF1178 family protein [Alphaproteobacteria bacterium]
MILFNLRCGENHIFEAWFRDGETYDRQSARGEVACPVCGISRIEKAPMAPRLGTGRNKNESDAEMARKIRGAFAELRDHVEKSCDYVGAEFAEEARKIHYGESEQRDIYGEASNEEAKDLADEGVAFGRIPWTSRTDS